ncbi:MiaB superfamily threonylcarbamoyladenosine tRNA methylthiotransferase [Lyticum sinuosum]|uniref:MiaB superfamily threonylcarbamoyladenosine tRNA methylthiotransferase n=1 Tax=Lyticum sinuosum TaxID=1332059 RepID=A0AAE4VMF4_9RICK|nr:tRNA (N(6)-L-threonylcarbamoyladenosine(37)-C(2))-methylthiotransferase MtaB [Lyticum sinuosum]MDZ5761578.1 MiaB superfamily threonylcarbamoyladenosine tRNA methylthiotransferase [Lyticum sinuosum]
MSNIDTTNNYNSENNSEKYKDQNYKSDQSINNNLLNLYSESNNNDSISLNPSANSFESKVINFGCRLNSSESDIISYNLKKLNVDNVIVINSCAVTKEAERQVKQTIRSLYKNHPEAKIYITGCASQTDKKFYENMPEVSGIIDNTKKLDINEYKKINNQLFSEKLNDITFNSKKIKNDIELSENDIQSRKSFVFPDKSLEIFTLESKIDKNWKDIYKNSFKGRGFVQIQNGCNHRCTFCIIPYGRGPSRSLPMANIVSQVKGLIDNGCGEIVFTGVDITDYGIDLPGHPKLGQIVRRLLNLVPDIKRIRLSSIDVAEIDEDILYLLANEKRFMPHLHISLQAGDDIILKRMKRRHNRQQIIDFCSHARIINPNIVFGADIIAGFPTETDDMFENTRNLLQECNIIYCHIFPYSERPETPAARMPQIPYHVRKSRAKILREDAKQRLLSYYNSQIGKTISVVIEGNGMARGENFGLIKIENSNILPKKLDNISNIIENNKNKNQFNKNIKDNLINNLICGKIYNTIITGIDSYKSEYCMNGIILN